LLSRWAEDGGDAGKGLDVALAAEVAELEPEPVRRVDRASDLYLAGPRVTWPVWWADLTEPKPEPAGLRAWLRRLF